MKQFKGHEIVLNIGTVKKVRDALQVDLTQPERGDPPLIAQIFDDDLFFIDVLQTLCPKLKCDELTGEEIAEALQLFLEEWRHFFTLRGRTDRAQMVQTTAKALKDIIEKTEKALGEISTDLPESSE